MSASTLVSAPVSAANSEGFGEHMDESLQVTILASLENLKIQLRKELLEEFLADLDSTQVFIERNNLVDDMTVRESVHFEQERLRIETEIADAQADIERLKEELIQAQVQINNTLEEIKQAGIEKIEIEEAKQLRIKHFMSVVAAIYEFQAMFNVSSETVEETKNTGHLVEIIQISKISTLASFASLVHLRELYLRQNHISDLRELLYLAELKSLRVLWLAENPITEYPAYRHSVLRILPHLDTLDDTPVSDVDRNAALAAGFPTEVELLNDMSHPNRDIHYTHQSDDLKYIRKRTGSEHLSVGTPRQTPLNGFVELQISRTGFQSAGHRSKVSHLSPSNSSQVLTLARTKFELVDIGSTHPGPESNQRPNWLRNQTEQSNLLVAVLALVKELDSMSLRIVRDEIDANLLVLDSVTALIKLNLALLCNTFRWKVNTYVSVERL
ncbi:hypothetical protein BSLG_005805 [Batrachochytrium salamandrivorans]|nr:hypothetical protein BSLG_005805 [Batrachochytrium salamandrivorans]